MRRFIDFFLKNELNYRITDVFKETDKFSVLFNYTPWQDHWDNIFQDTQLPT